MTLTAVPVACPPWCTDHNLDPGEEAHWLTVLDASRMRVDICRWRSEGTVGGTVYLSGVDLSTSCGEAILNREQALRLPAALQEAAKLLA